MRRHLAHPYGQTMSSSRVMSLLMALAVLWMMYSRFKDPATWAWMTSENLDADKAAVVQKPKSPDSAKPLPSEEVVPGPNEEDADELVKLRKSLEVIEDKRPLQPHEMPIYWRLMAWSRTRSFADLERLARHDVPFTQLWEQPDLYRGHSIHLRLHVKMVVKWTDIKDNRLGLKEVYEVWGWTDNSRSYPYLVIVSELPPGLKVGTDVDGEIVFAGYFLKWMSYQAFDVKKQTPLLIGRAKLVSPRGGRGQAWETAFLALVGGVAFLGALTWFVLNSWRRPAPSLLPASSLPEFLPEPVFAQNEISNLKSQISNFKSEISNLESQISNLESEIQHPETQGSGPLISATDSRSSDGTSSSGNPPLQDGA